MPFFVGFAAGIESLFEPETDGGGQASGESPAAAQENCLGNRGLKLGIRDLKTGIDV